MELDIRFTVYHGIIVADLRDLNPKHHLYRWETTSTEVDGMNLSVPNLLWDKMRLAVSPAGNEVDYRGQSGRNDEKEAGVAAGHFEAENYDILGLIRLVL
jgi:hypothetical protein